MMNQTIYQDGVYGGMPSRRQYPAMRQPTMTPSVASKPGGTIKAVDWQSGTPNQAQLQIIRSQQPSMTGGAGYASMVPTVSGDPQGTVKAVDWQGTSPTPGQAQILRTQQPMTGGAGYPSMGSAQPQAGTIVRPPKQPSGYDWSFLNFDPNSSVLAGLNLNSESPAADPGGVKNVLGLQDELTRSGIPLIGSRSGLFDMGNGTYEARTLRGDPSTWAGRYSHERPYERAMYRLVTRPDGTRGLEQTSAFERYAEADSRDNWEDYARFAAMAAAGGYGSYAAGSALGAAGVGAEGAAAAGAAGGGSSPVWNAALAESAAGTGGYGASSLGAGGGASASWGAMSGAQTAAYDAAIAQGMTPSQAAQAAAGAGAGSGGAGGTGGNAPNNATANRTPSSSGLANQGLSRLFGAGVSALAAGGSGSGTGGSGVGGLDGLAGESGAMATRIANAQASMMEFANEQARAEQARRNAIFVPIENRIAREAQEYDTPGRRSEASARAAADVEANAGRAVQDMNRSRLARGGAIDDGGSGALDIALGKARMRSSATDKAVKDIEGQGYARMMDAAGIGRGVFQNQATQQSLGNQSGNSATQQFNTPAGIYATQARMAQLNQNNSAQQAQLWGQVLGGVDWGSIWNWWNS